MVASIANQEAIERFVRKVIVARETLVADTANLNTPWHARSLPEDHYRIASSTRIAHDLTSWLSEKRNDPAARVSSSLLLSVSIAEDEV
ncbi:hypothetical protein JVU11DRAFT_7301 [Chiua virens]|nr:hypothetical protein JVU11DRAFT_7301 [Chiua virens]